MKTTFQARFLGWVLVYATLTLAALASCANPALDSVVPAAAPVASSAASPEAAPAAGTSVYSLTLAWNAGGSRSILPASYPLPVSYDITLHPAVGSDVTRSLAATTCTFDGLQAVAYAVSVSGRDSGGNVVVSGAGSADMRAAAPVHATIVLNYSSSGGTGQMHLTFSCATAVTGTPTMTLVSPSGVVTSGIALSGSSPTFSYANDSAAAGTWKLFSAFASGTKSAMKLETVLVLRNIDTVGTLSIAAGDFSTTLVAVSGLALNASTMTLNTAGATGSLAATVSPAGASNQLVAWTSSTPDVASVDQNGTVTPVAAGTATITAKSVDHPAATASCAVTVLATYGVTYDTNGATGSAPATQTKVQGTGLTLSANSGSLVRSGYIFAGWNTAANGGGTDYSVGATYTANTALALFAKWTAISYSIGYTLNGGTNNVSNPAAYTIASSTITLADPSRAGYSFSGWFTDAGLTAAISQIAMGSTGNLALYAKWTALPTYTVTFNANGASSGTAPAAQTKTQGTDLTLATNSGSLALTGNSFGGWNTLATGLGTSYPAGGTYSANAAVTLYATWTTTANLSALALSGSPSGYAFSAGTYSYSGILVPNATTSVTVAPTGAGVITVNGTAVASGSVSGSIALGAGTAATITVVATETGKTAKTYTLSVTRLPTVGGSFGGGVLAYILVNGDPGWVSGQQHGLIAAAADQGSAPYALAAYTATSVPTGTRTAIGTGSSLTDAIIIQNGAGTGYAAGLARAYRGGNYTNWFLPSKDELNKLYLNKTAIGNMTGTFYMSSSDGTTTICWVQRFTDGLQEASAQKSYVGNVRAVRAF